MAISMSCDMHIKFNYLTICLINDNIHLRSFDIKNNCTLTYQQDQTL